MNLNVTPMNNANNSPQFGMAVRVKKGAFNVMERQATRLGKGKDEFIEEFKRASNAEKNNFIDIVISKVFGKDKLKATVVDDMGIAKKRTFTQKFKTDSQSNTNFLDSAREYANEVKDTRNKMHALKDVVAENLE